MKFSQLGLAEPLLRVTESLKYETATPVQAAAIPIVMTGADLVACAQTGTGKTAGFTLPLLHRLLQNTEAPKPPQPTESSGKPRRGRHASPRKLRALVLAPTRELAAQIDDSFRRYARFTKLRSAVIYGGVKQGAQVKALQRGVDTLVATPGRLLDLMNQGFVDLGSIELLVFDEADQMLDMGFVPDLKRIVAKTPRARQTVMFSATMPDPIRALTREWMRDQQSVDVTPRAQSSPKKISQSVHLVDKGRKHDLLTHYLRSTERSRTVVFSRTKHGADKIAKRLVRDGFEAAAIHGNKSQNARNRTLARFKGSRPPVLVATDIAARGLDIRDVSHVVNFDLPDAAETYVHRIGRTGRAGASGVAVSFCSADESRLLREIEKLTKARIRVEPVIEGFERKDPQPKPQGKPAGKKPYAKKAFRGRRNRSPQGGAGSPKGPGKKAAKKTTAKKTHAGRKPKAKRPARKPVAAT